MNRARHLQRKRKNRGRAGRRNAVAALTAGAAIAAGTQAYAEQIRFDNPPGDGHFAWFDGVVGNCIGLDITLAAGSQTGAWDGPSGAATQFGQYSAGFAAFIDAGVGAGLQVGGPGNGFLVGVDEGVSIPGVLPWDSTGLIYYAGYGSMLPEGQQTYLGVRFDPGDGLHYGWIGVVRQDTTWLDAFAWGYETEAGMGIPAGAPEPGSLALLAFGALGAASRRRR